MRILDQVRYQSRRRWLVHRATRRGRAADLYRVTATVRNGMNLSFAQFCNPNSAPIAGCGLRVADCELGIFNFGL